MLNYAAVMLQFCSILLNFARPCKIMLDYAKLCCSYAQLCSIMLNYANYALCSDSAIMPKSNAGIIGLAQPAHALWRNATNQQGEE